MLNPQPALGTAYTQSNPGVAADMKAMESQFVDFKPNFPLVPGSLNLFGYERERVANSYVILSPDKTRFVISQVVYLPDNQQTASRVYLYPVGEAPTLAQVVPPEQMTNIRKEQEKYPGRPPQVAMKEIDPYPFWARYQPEKQIAQQQLLAEAGFDSPEAYRVDILHVADWSADGERLLILHRPGIHHLGVRKTIPMVYDFAYRELVRLTFLPGLIWSDFLRQHPEMGTTAKRVWDIRPLGWHTQDPAELIVKLVLFEGQSELSAGLWRYNTQTGVLGYLGEEIPQDLVARNGWLVTFKDPHNSEGPKTYAPGEPPPSKPEAPAPKRTWRNRLQFWKKQP